MQCVKVANSNAEWEGGNNHHLKVCISAAQIPRTCKVNNVRPGCVDEHPKISGCFSIKHGLPQLQERHMDSVGHCINSSSSSNVKCVLVAS